LGRRPIIGNGGVFELDPINLEIKIIGPGVLSSGWAWNCGGTGLAKAGKERGQLNGSILPKIFIRTDQL
jgi:hypothetical protein